MDGIIEDEELGRIVVRVNTRARHLVFRTKSDAIYVSVPPGTSAPIVRKAIEELRDRLSAHRKKIARRLIDLNFRIDTELFRLCLTSGTNDRFLSRSHPGNMEIICPSGTDFGDERIQDWLRKVIVEALRRQAKVLLPPRLKSLSERSGLPFAGVKITTSRGRWGSCSVRKDINLSCFLLLLPVHLIDYVLLHELCHTREMNHGERFWALLNRVTDNRAPALRDELKKARMEEW